MLAHPDRIYFLARLWVGYTEEFSVAWFDDTPDQKLWERAAEELNATISFDPDDYPASSGPPAPPQPDEWTDYAEGLQWARPRITDDPIWLSLPTWRAFHLRDDDLITADLVEALLARLRNDHVFWSYAQLRIKTVARKDLKPSEWANFERDIALLDGDRRPSVTMKLGKVYPFNELRDEAVELSQPLIAARKPSAAPSATNPNVPSRPNRVSVAFWAQLDPTKQRIIAALAKATDAGEGRSLDQLLIDAGVKDDSTISRAVEKMREMGADIPNPRNATGYTLGSVPAVPQKPGPKPQPDAKKTPKHRSDA